MRDRNFKCDLRRNGFDFLIADPSARCLKGRAVRVLVAEMGTGSVAVVIPAASAQCVAAVVQVLGEKPIVAAPGPTLWASE